MMKEFNYEWKQIRQEVNDKVVGKDNNSMILEQKYAKMIDCIKSRKDILKNANINDQINAINKLDDTPLTKAERVDSEQKAHVYFQERNEEIDKLVEDLKLQAKDWLKEKMFRCHKIKQLGFSMHDIELLKLTYDKVEEKNVHVLYEKFFKQLQFARQVLRLYDVR